MDNINVSNNKTIKTDKYWALEFKESCRLGAGLCFYIDNSKLLNHFQHMDSGRPMKSNKLRER